VAVKIQRYFTKHIYTGYPANRLLTGCRKRIPHFELEYNYLLFLNARVASSAGGR